jgi:hypothetical protein
MPAAFPIGWSGAQIHSHLRFSHDVGVNLGLTVAGLPGRPSHRVMLAGFWPHKAA